MGNRLHDITLRMPSTGAGTDERILGTVILPSSKGYVTKAYLVPEATSTEDASNYTDLSIEVGGATLGTHSTDSAADGTLTAETPVELSLSGDRTVEDGDLIAFDKTDSGTGVAFEGSLVLQIEERPIP